jgi:tetratricopeptide (TPR) repeat protein
MRSAARESTDGEVVGRWLLGELIVPGGDRKRAVEARKRLDTLPGAQGMFASLARGIDDEAHGLFRAASKAHLQALASARSDTHVDAPLVGWFATSHLLRLRPSVQELWTEAKPVIEKTLDSPGNVGWRARSELVEWWTVEAFRGASPTSGIPDAGAKRHGCVAKARLAGPFGHLASTDHRVRYEAERPGPWPLRFPRDPQRLEAPRTLDVERHGCQLRAAEPVGPGVFYVETFLDLPAEREIIVAVQGSFAVFVDDVEVLSRDRGQWGIWPRFGARVRLGGGRHRILARIGGPETAIRLLTPSGTPLAIEASDDPTPPYALVPPERRPDPNPIEPFLTALGVPRQPGTPPGPPRDVDDPIARYLAAYLAHIEGQEDVSAVLIEPLVKNIDIATAQALAIQAVYLEKDPIFPEGDARDLARDLRARAVAKDSELWWPRLWLTLDEADKKGLPEVAPQVVALADKFREVPDILKGLGAMYARIGWKAEHARAVKEAAARFPQDPEALGALHQLYDAQGRVAEADQVAAQIRKLDPSSEVDFERAIERRDYAAAIKELKRLGELRKDRKDIALRIADLLTRAGKTAESMEKLELAVSRSPTDADARLALADARFAGGDKGALRKALVDAIQTGSDTDALRDATELVDGVTELEPFREDGKKVIADFEASKQQMPGTAARVLDYSAMWIHSDGSARMLEHEIICIQSREAIREHAEQRVPRGLILKLRTIKRDGRVFEPEFVEGKATVTMPHLEIGDYVESEVLISLRGDGQGGLVFTGPRWFFREEKLAYWRSEFITVSPKSRPLDVEVGGAVPAPQVTENGALVTRRWRVDKSPALPEEPGSAPIEEFLPNVRIGWGVNLANTLKRMVDAADDETPRDPRLLRIAQGIINDELTKAAPLPGRASGQAAGAGPAGSPRDSAPEGANSPPAERSGGAEAGEEAEPGSPRRSNASLVEPPRAQPRPRAGKPAHTIDEKARRIYRWVLANVESGRESDGRRVVIGGSGNRTEAFLYLSRLVGLDVSLGIVRDRLTAESRGPLSEAESFNALAVRLATENGPRWFVVREKFAPYGYLPSSLRGQPAVVLRAGAPRETTTSAGARDGITHEGVAELNADGSATIDLLQHFEGKFAIQLRGGLEQVAEARLKDIIESRLLPQSLPGARLKDLELRNLDDLDSPLTLAMKVEITNFARPRGSELVISPPFVASLGMFASLPSRETPLYLSEALATRILVKLRVKLPAGARVTTALTPSTAEDDGRSVTVRDRVDGDALLFERTIDIPAGRVKPEAYPAFQSFTRRADAALHRDIGIALAAPAR